MYKTVQVAGARHDRRRRHRRRHYARERRPAAPPPAVADGRSKRLARRFSSPSGGAPLRVKASALQARSGNQPPGPESPNTRCAKRLSGQSLPPERLLEIQMMSGIMQSVFASKAFGSKTHTAIH